MPGDIGSGANVKGYIINLTTGQKLEFMENPEKIEVSVGVVHSRAQIPGLSHRRTQYISTDNREFSFSLMFDALSLGGGKAGRKKVEHASLFLQSLMFPRRFYRIDGSGNSPILFAIPGSHMVRGLMSKKMKISEELFFTDTALRRFTVSCVVIEEPRTKITAMEVLHSGIQTTNLIADSDLQMGSALEKNRLRQNNSFKSTAVARFGTRKVTVSSGRR